MSIICDPDQDPHSYEASAQNQLALSKADLVIENGGGYDDFIDRMVKASTGQRPGAQRRRDLRARRLPPAASSTSTSGTTSRRSTRLADEVADGSSTAIDGGRGALHRQTPRRSPPRSRPREPRRRSSRPRTAEGESPSPSRCRSTCSRRSACTTRPRRPSALQSRRAPTCPRRFSQQTLDLFTRDEVKALVYNEQTSGPITEAVEEGRRAAGVPVVRGDRDAAGGHVVRHLDGRQPRTT